jgi:hypothetical protein
MKRLLTLPVSSALRVCLPCGGPVLAFIALIMIAYLP